MITEELKKLYCTYTGHEPGTIEELPSSGSNRRYFRLTGTPTLIGVSGTSLEENQAFLYMADHFRKKGLPVPQVVAKSDNDAFYLQEDLGDTLLFNAIEKGRKTSVFDEEEKQLLRKTMRLLPAVQFSGADGMNFSYCYPQSEFNSRSILWDLNYFKYCFLKATGMEFQEDRLEDDFLKMADVLMRSSSATFMYRDFQSRNVMIKEGEPWLIDFQGGRKGPVYYDVASFLWQAKANYPDSLRKELLKEYLDSLCKYQPVDEKYFYAQLRHFVLFRTMQVLGAYGFRGYFPVVFQEADDRFIQSGERFVTVVLAGIVHRTAVEYETTSVSAGIFGNAFLICKAGNFHNKTAFLQIVSELFQFGKFFQYMAEVRIFGIRFL